MSKTEFTASANVRVTVEVMNLGPYGADWTADKIHEQTSMEAVNTIVRVLSAGQKALRGAPQDGKSDPVPGLRIIGEPEVVIVSQRRVKP